VKSQKSLFIYVWAPPNNDVINFSFVILCYSLGLINLNIVEINDFCDPHISGSIEFIVNSSLSLIPSFFGNYANKSGCPLHSYANLFVVKYVEYVQSTNSISFINKHGCLPSITFFN